MCIRDSLGTSRELANAGYVSCSEVELRTIVVEERGMTTTLVFGQNVNLCGKLVVAFYGCRLTQNLSTLDLSSLDTTKPVSYTHLDCPGCLRQ